MNKKLNNKIIAVFLFVIISVVFLIILFLLIKPYPLKYKEEINYVANKYQLSPSLIASIIYTESSFQTDCISSKGAVGLMQLMPKTAKWLCEKQNINYNEAMLKNPLYNLDLGSYYLSYLITKFKNLNTVLYAYNAGEGNVQIWLKDSRYTLNGVELTSSPYPETNAYVKKVNKVAVYYKKIFQF